MRKVCDFGLESGIFRPQIFPGIIFCPVYRKTVTAPVYSRSSQVITGWSVSRKVVIKFKAVYICDLWIVKIRNVQDNGADKEESCRKADEDSEDPAAYTFCAPLSLEQIFCTDDGYSCGRHAQKDPEGCVSYETCSAHGDNLVVHYDEKYAGAEDQKKGRGQENCIPKFGM